MTDVTVPYVMAFCIAMILLALTVTAYEFRRMSNLQGRGNRLALPAAPEASPTGVRTWSAR